MKQINGYWVDENNNRWDCELYSEAKAERYSKTLIECTECTDCYNCDHCKLCNYCEHCHNCYNCYNCDHCHNCYNCDYCKLCNYCDHCNYCYNCDNFKTNPQIYKTRKIGSRNARTVFYYGETHKGMEVQVVCGCFKGNLEEFKNAVLETHKNNDKYREQYLSEISKVKVLFELNK